ncbi:MAG: transketolase [Rhizobiaceae bacterium]|nr:transketolase [Rhizobiaceae bacterium]
MNMNADISADIKADETQMANAIRALSMDAVQKANSGHPGMPMGMADVATVLFNRFINIDPSNPKWPDRDRFVLSAGHGSMLLYSIHHLLGFADMTKQQLSDFRQLGAKTAGHPEYGHADGIETTTGPLGQGIATAVGMALGERMMAARFGPKLVDHFTYVIAGDGCLQEGISHEAIDLAGHLKLSRLILLWDDNDISIDGAISLSTSMNQAMRFKAAGWHVSKVDGHNPEEIAAAIEAARKSRKPSFIACKTVIGKGAPNKQGSHKVHGAPLGEDEIAATRKSIGWSHSPFEVPAKISAMWQAISARGKRARTNWAARLEASPRNKSFEVALAGDMPATLNRKLSAFRREHVDKETKVATRKASEMVLEVVNSATKLTIGGSADLTGSNLTITSGMETIKPGKFKGRYIHYGIREHGMSAAMNGLALHGGFVPYGGTFMVFSDYARGAMRLSALMEQRVIYVLTHDSIGLGEDGPTHQPVEHLAMLRATPNINVYRPADIIETAECWELALNDKSAPGVLVLSRQGLPMLRTSHNPKNLSQNGAYVLLETQGPRDVTLIATGSEVEIAKAASDALLAESGIKAAVISMPCWEKFETQSDEYQANVLGSAPRIAIEAAARMGWDRWIGANGKFIGMNSFGASAPAPDLYKHFGITAENIAKTARDLIK